MSERVVVVGASLAGVRCAEALRRYGHAGPITLLGQERHRPYDRPPLSKQFLAGVADRERLWLNRSATELADADITHRPGVNVTSVDVAGHELVTSDGPVPFDSLVIATGTTARRLPHPDGAPVFVLRTLDDSEALAPRLRDGARVVVIGAGFIGAEVASTARSKGCEVTVVEAAPVPLERQLGAQMGAACAELHARNGVRLLVGTGVVSIGERYVELSTGERLPADLIVVGIGVTPNTEWLHGSGVAVDDGVVCDAACRALDGTGGPLSDIVACGDVARWTNERYDESMRIEHWTNAVEMADHAAQTLLGSEAPFTPVPYFWSDQYGTKIQFLGRSTGFDEVRVVDGDTSQGPGVALYRKGDLLIGALGLSRIKAVMGYRALLTENASWTDALAHAGIES